MRQASDCQAGSPPAPPGDRSRLCAFGTEPKAMAGVRPDDERTLSEAAESKLAAGAARGHL